MTERQSAVTTDRYGPPRQSLDAGARPEERPVDAETTTTDRPQGQPRHDPTTVTGLLEQWTASVAGIPFMLLTAGGLGRLMSGTVWVDCTLDMVEALARIQRRSVEQMLTTHSKVVGQFAESARTIAAAGPDLTAPRRPNPKGQDRPRDSSS